MKPAADILKPTQRLSMWDWNVQHVDFALDQSYKAASYGRYDPTLMPWWRQIVDAIDDPNIKEIIAVIPSQGGKEEHCLCFPARYWAGTNRNMRVLYVGHQEQLSEEIFIDRLKGGMRITQPTRNLLGTVKERGMVYQIGQTVFGCTHGGTGGGLKGKPWDAVLCSEASSYKSVAIIDEARKRGITRPFFKLVVWGCPDWRQKKPSDEDALFIEYDKTNQCEFMMPDPKTGNLFAWRVGDGTADGLYWDESAKRQDGSYDLNLVEQTAHYITPDGTVLREEERLPLIAKGRFVAQVADAPAWKMGFHAHQLMFPWKDVGGFGHIARRYLESQASGMESYRAFRYEVEAAKWYGERTTIEINAIEDRRGSYKTGTKASHQPAYAYLAAKRSITLMTVDVQKSGQWYVVREWFDGGDSAMIDCGFVDSWRDLATIKAKYSVARAFVDLGYPDRRNEVLEQCLFGEMKGMVPAFGRESLREPYKVEKRDPFEGTAKQGRSKLPIVTFSPNQIKHILSNLTTNIDPHQWLLPCDPPSDYVRQMTAEECIDGAWTAKRRDNHLWDCETMQLVAAMVLGIFRQVGINLDAIPDAPTDAQPVQQATAYQPAPSRRRGVYYN